jgi:hypothetical protein
MDQKQPNRQQDQQNKDAKSGQPVQLDKDKQGQQQGGQQQGGQQHQGGQQMPGREQQQGDKQHQGAENR